MSGTSHASHAWHKLRDARMATARTNNEPCCRCGQPIDYTLDGRLRMGPSLDHLVALVHGGNLLAEPDQLAPSHRSCNASHGAKVGNQMRGVRRHPERFLDVALPSPARISHFVSPVVPDLVRTLPETLSTRPRFPGERDGLPRIFSPIHPEAVGSLGDEMVAHAGRRRGEPLRWFQWVTAQRRYEVRGDGSWCWPLVFESTPRQQGKSVTLAEDAAWFCGRTSEPELVLHAAHRVKTSLDVQSDLWPWAEGRGLEVRRLLGDSRIIWPQGAVWATVAMESAYGRRPWRLLMDEAWAMHPVRFWNSLFPALGDRVSPQALFWSTANPEERGLVSDLRGDESVCRMEWGALDGEDPADENVWRTASAFWGGGRLGLMRSAVKRPGFTEEWLNVWPELGAAAVPWGERVAARLLAQQPTVWVAPRVAGLESEPDGSGWGVAVSDGRHVHCVAVPRLADALVWLNAMRPERVLMHEAVAKQLEGTDFTVVKVSASDARAATAVLRDGAAGLSWSGVLGEQLPLVNVSTSVGGESIDAVRSVGPVSAVKAAAWCLWSARTTPAEVAAIW